MKKILKTLSILLFLLAFLFVAKPILAAVRCEEQYGGGEICVRTGELRIDKKVWDPETAQFVEDLGIHDYKFAPGEEVIFKLTIENVGDETLGKLDVRDYLPSYLEHLSGDLSFEIYDLIIGETEVREIKVKVVSADQIPDDQATICVVNTAEAWGDDEKDKDTAQVCIEEKVLGVEILPPTGPEEALLVLGLSIFSAVLGTIFLRKAKEGSWKT